MWYWAPCNIYKDERILKYDCNNSFENFKNAFIEFHNRDKRGLNPQPWIASLPFN